MKKYFIPYKNKNGCVVDWDFQSIIHCINWFKNGRGYAETNLYLGKKNGKEIRKNITMHRLLSNFPKDEVNHVNGKRNDNRKENLKIVTHRQIGHNRNVHRNGKLVGANFYKPTKTWRSQITINGKVVHLGTFDTEQQAHEAYMKKFNSIGDDYNDM
jgi:hypothetical protein